MNAKAIIQDFIAAWNRGDMNLAFSLMDDDIIWHNIPMQPAIGIEACKALLAQFSPIEAANWETHHIAVAGNVVLTERTDRFLIGGKWRSIRLMGIFELSSEGKIAKWRDYFDMLEFQREFS